MIMRRGNSRGNYRSIVKTVEGAERSTLLCFALLCSARSELQMHKDFSCSYHGGPGQMSAPLSHRHCSNPI